MFLRFVKAKKQSVVCTLTLPLVLAASLVHAASYQYRLPIEGLRATEAALPDEPQDHAIEFFGTYRAWADGTLATNCNAYRNAPASYTYSGATGDGIYRIQPSSGPALDVFCDMTTDGGGWTLLSQVSGTGTAVQMPTVSIDDHNLSFHEVLLVAGADKNSNYHTGKTDAYKGPGVNIAWDGLRFDWKWYFAATTPSWRGYGASSTSPYQLTLSNSVAWPNSNYTILAPVQSSCRFRDTFDVYGFCGQAVKVSAPPGMRLTGYNDIESLEGSVVDNHIVRTMNIFVR